MKFENIRVMNFENAIRGMRHPKLSYHLSDSEFGLGNIEWAEEDFMVADRWLQYILGSIGVPKYSPIKASMCFLIRGVKCMVVGVLTPYTSSKYLN